MKSLKNLYRKFFGHKPEIEEKRYNSSQTLIDNLANPHWMHRNYHSFAEEGYVKNVIVNRCVTLVAQSAASVPWKLFKNYQEEKIEVKHHPLLDLLSKPNVNQAGAEFFENLYSYKMISGNAYIQAVKIKGKLPKELYLIRPDRVNIVAKEEILGYEYGSYQEKIFFPKDSVTGKCAILHLKNFHPLNELYGLSQLEAASYSIDQHNEASKWNQSMLENGARPSGALIVKNEEARGSKTLSEHEYRRLKDEIEHVYSSAANAGKPMLLEGGLEWKEMSLSPRDMDFLESKNNSAREIALSLGVPPQLLGITGDVTYSNMQEARLSLWEETIIPILDHMADALNNWLVPMYGEELKIAYDVDNISGLAERREKIWSRLENASFLTNNEKRAILGLSPLENNSENME